MLAPPFSDMPTAARKRGSWVGSNTNKIARLWLKWRVTGCVDSSAPGKKCSPALSYNTTSDASCFMGIAISNSLFANSLFANSLFANSPSACAPVCKVNISGNGSVSSLPFTRTARYNNASPEISVLAKRTISFESGAPNKIFSSRCKRAFNFGSVSTMHAPARALSRRKPHVIAASK